MALCSSKIPLWLPCSALQKSMQIVAVLLAGTISIGCSSLPIDSWKANMETYGQTYCDSGDNYYDAARVFYQIADYTGGVKWSRCAEHAVKAYRDGYLKPNQFKAAGWMIFPHGLLMHYERTGDASSKEALIGMATNAAFAHHEVDPYMVRIDGSREVAYNIESKLLAEAVGYNDRAEVQRLVGLAMGHYDQWFISRTAEYVRPFMAALTAEALILWHEKTHDPKVLPLLKTGADWMWDHMWVSGIDAFKYTDKQMSHGGTEPAPDLNLLIVPLYGWLYKMTGDDKYCERGDKIFAAGVLGAQLNDPKHFNQNYRWSFDYVKWREGRER
ncbi:MAG: hypothetical protein M3Z35_10460 [Nitrospirota bacterium]|nr:hypothetical protein [Nitrospirota bacterium]